MLAERGAPIDDEAITRGFAATSWPGRLERISERPEIYVDGTHNPAGAREIAVFWEQFLPGRNIYLIYGAMRDKAVDEIAGLLFPRASVVILTTPAQSRAISAPLLAEMTSHHARRADGSNVVFCRRCRNRRDRRTHLSGVAAFSWRQRRRNGVRRLCGPDATDLHSNYS